MSNAIYPTLPGLAFPVMKQPGFNTAIKQSVSGKEYRAAFMQYPLWTFELTYEFLRNGIAGNDLNTLTGFFLARQGAFDSFLFTEPSDCTVTDAQFAVGDGVTKSFQLVRSLGAFVEAVQNVNILTNIKAGGTLVPGSSYTVSPTGLVTFTTAPTSGYSLTWSGTFYFRVRFLQDSSQFSQFMTDLWENKKVQFIGSTSNKV
ncbi:DUF2460 domain-containing protein [Herbaspirillum sp. RV1423]|uniref:DUF2460 domain-containing protein n=1 Tax=Herbaspirillum sp. RV1423 TaxID=1443993 RepID=UPI0005576D7B|nr:DUF2460 domain-containing protein [Herbaspirillum sp. RV1423]